MWTALSRQVLPLVLAAAAAPVAIAGAQTLDGIAILPADTFLPGPTSGQLIAPANGRVPPFVDRQPVQGFSSILRSGPDEFLAMGDNGFGARPNSADYLLRVYRLQPRFRTRQSSSGEVAVVGFETLHDPDRKIGFPIVADAGVYPGTSITVDPELRRQRWLTGGDLDIESMRQAPDGTLWFGDEFGPFLVHTDAKGRLLEAPIPLPGVQSPQNPFLASAAPTLAASRGFEGLALSPDGRSLYSLLEGPLTSDTDQRRLTIHEFDIARRQYTGRRWSYRLEADAATGQSIGDFVAAPSGTFLVIERDNLEGAAAAFKKIFVVDLDDVDSAGFLVKREVADLLRLADPDRLSGPEGVFRFPFQTIESVAPLDDRTLVVVNDNNYPFSAGRVAGQADPSEFIRIRLDRPIRRRSR